MSTSRNRKLLVSLVAVLGLAGAACGGDDTETAVTGEDAPAEETEDGTETETETGTETETETGTEGDLTLAAGPQGEACPDDVESMSTQPAASAAESSEELTTLVSALTDAGLAATLDGEGPYTVFAPVNDAFEAVPEDELQALLDDPEQLTEVLTYHVVQGEALDAATALEAGSATTLQGSDLEIMDMGETVMVGDANVVCANIEVENGVVHLIDSVLMPE